MAFRDTDSDRGRCDDPGSAMGHAWQVSSRTGLSNANGAKVLGGVSRDGGYSISIAPTVDPTL